MRPHVIVEPGANDDRDVRLLEYQWLDRCSARLLAAWPELSGTDTDDIACDLLEEHGVELDPLKAAADYVQRCTHAKPRAALTQGSDLS